MILLAIAFGAGMLYERGQQAHACPPEAGVPGDIDCE